MDKGPEFRIVGGASEEKKEEARKELESALFDHFASLSPKEREKLEKLEYTKSEKEIALINFANEETNRLREEAGLEPYDIPKENYHIVPSEFYKEVGKDGTATTFYTKQGIIFDAEQFRLNPVNFGTASLHETLHLKGHTTFEVEEKDGKLEKTPFRVGIGIEAAQKFGLHGKYHSHFDGLHEAIVVTQEKKSFPKILELPMLKKEKEWLMSREAKKIIEGIREKKNIPKDEFIWVEGEELEGWEEGKTGSSYKWKTFSYYSQRQTLEYLCNEIQGEFPERYKSSDDVFNEFLKAHFTGRLLTVARLVEKTFGEGSFRLLGNMRIDKESGVLHLEALRKKRIRITESKL